MQQRSKKEEKSSRVREKKEADVKKGKKKEGTQNESNIFFSFSPWHEAHEEKIKQSSQARKKLVAILSNFEGKNVKREESEGKKKRIHILTHVKAANDYYRLR